MYKKMLVLLDGSKLAEIVFSYAQELAGRLSLDLDLLNVCTPQEADELPMHEAYIEHMAAELQKKCEEIRLATENGDSGSCIIATGKVVVGYPAEEILKYAEENQVDLIMLSTHGRSGIRMWNLGSVANKVIHASNVPVWIVPSELRDEVIHDKVPHRTMVIPFDGSKTAEAVIPHSINIARQRGAETSIVLVYVEPLNSIVLGIEHIKQQQEDRLAMKKYLDKVVQEIKAAGIEARAEVLMGDAPAKIIEFVKNNPTQLIAMATRGYSGLSRLVFGSVAESIIQLVKKTPIFVVRTTE